MQRDYFPTAGDYCIFVVKLVVIWTQMNFYNKKVKYPCVRETQSVYGSKTKKEKMILDLLTKQGSITRKDVQEYLGISQATAIVVLREMLEQGKLKKEGTGRFQRYYI